jgi:hypothetical protein
MFVAASVPDIDAKGEVGFGFHGQVRLDSSRPAGIYTAMLRLAQKSTVQKRRSMSAPRTGKLAPVTLGHMRAHGCRDSRPVLASLDRAAVATSREG